MNAFWNSSETLIGLGVEPMDLTFVQISLRGVIVFLITLITMRLAHKRSLARKTPFDAVLLVILAAVLSRAINGSAAFFATLGGGVVLVVLHRLFAFLAFYSHGFGILVKGKPDVIVRDGQSDLAMMWRNHVSTHDLDEDMRLSAHTDDVSTIRVARVEPVATSALSRNDLTCRPHLTIKPTGFMKRTKKRWIKPMLKTVPIFFECTCYAGSI
jgi:hypothetical protein